MRTLTSIAALMALAVAAAGCGSDAGGGGGGGLVDSGANDAGNQDGTASDGTASDSATGDTAAADTATADGTATDTTSADTASGDTATGDTATGDTATGDTATGDTAVDASDVAQVDAIAGADLKAGDLVITEILADSMAVPDETGEWFEVQNRTGKAVDLRGLKIEDKTAKAHEIAGPAQVIVPAGGYAVLCITADKGVNGGVTCAYAYGDKVKLTNSGDTIKLVASAGVVDEVSYANGGDKGWPALAKGHAQQLAVEATSATVNDDGNNWCVAQATFGAGDFGSPGSANPACAPDADKDGVVDSADNCPSTWNPTQYDEDQDGIGSNCDNCPKVANKDQADSDKDGVGDACPPAVCGDGKQEFPEECDDGNKTVGDGCSPDCKIEAAKIAKGDLVITELLIDPVAVDDTKGEYIEVYNPTGAAITLDGIVIVNKTNKHTISPASPLVVPSKGFVVLGINADSSTNGGVKVDYAWKSIALGNSGSDIALMAGDVEVDKVTYTGSGSNGWPKYKNGASIQLSSAALTATANDDPKNWCESTAAVAGGDKGTPGSANASCAQ